MLDSSVVVSLFCVFFLFSVFCWKCREHSDSDTCHIPHLQKDSIWNPTLPSISSCPCLPHWTAPYCHYHQSSLMLAHVAIRAGVAASASWHQGVSFQDGSIQPRRLGESETEKLPTEPTRSYAMGRPCFRCYLRITHQGPLQEDGGHTEETSLDQRCIFVSQHYFFQL